MGKMHGLLDAPEAALAHSQDITGKYLFRLGRNLRTELSDFVAVNGILVFPEPFFGQNGPDMHAAYFCNEIKKEGRAGNRIIHVRAYTAESKDPQDPMIKAWLSAQHYPLGSLPSILELEKGPVLGEKCRPGKSTQKVALWYKNSYAALLL